jgi:hypothetical protein
VDTLTIGSRHFRRTVALCFSPYARDRSYCMQMAALPGGKESAIGGKYARLASIAYLCQIGYQRLSVKLRRMIEISEYSSERGPKDQRTLH